MEPLIAKQRFQNITTFSPGVVGSIGVTNLTLRNRSSAPDLPINLDDAWSGSIHQGSNVQDGSIISHDSFGGPSRVYDTNWNSGRDFKTSHGWVYQDLRVPDRRFEPIMGSTGRYSWNNKIATVYEAKRTGDMFLPLPGPYQLAPGEVPRGGATPVVVGTFGDGPSPLVPNNKNVIDTTNTGYPQQLTGGLDINSVVQNGLRNQRFENVQPPGAQVQNQVTQPRQTDQSTEPLSPISPPVPFLQRLWNASGL